MLSLRMLISGRVQGVGFRQYVKRVAEGLQVTGWVKNLDNGDVFVIAEAKQDALEQFVTQVNRGPLLSKVERVLLEWGRASGKYSQFFLERDKAGIINDQISAMQSLKRQILGGVMKENREVSDQELEIFPRHLVIIPDGNRRWAKEKSLFTLEGHKVGLQKRFKEICEYIFSSKIEVLTFWCFSTENWQRSEEEVSYLMNLFLQNVDEISEMISKYNLVFRHLGRKTHLSREILDKLQDLEEKTKENTGKTLCLAMDYGGRDEIVRAIQKISNTQEVTVENFGKFLDTSGLPDPDFIIRTSGEHRLSGILPWQSVYSELFFCDKYFPDFQRQDLLDALYEFQNRRRRFGR